MFLRVLTLIKELAWFDGVSSEHVENFCNSLYDISEKIQS